MRFEDEGWELELHKPEAPTLLWRRVLPTSKLRALIEVYPTFRADGLGLTGQLQREPSKKLGQKWVLATLGQEWNFEQHEIGGEILILKVDTVVGRALPRNSSWKRVEIRIEDQTFALEPHPVSGFRFLGANGVEIFTARVPWKDSESNAGIAWRVTPLLKAAHGPLLVVLSSLVFPIHVAQLASSDVS